MTTTILSKRRKRPCAILSAIALATAEALVKEKGDEFLFHCPPRSFPSVPADVRRRTTPFHVNPSTDPLNLNLNSYLTRIILSQASQIPGQSSLLRPNTGQRASIAFLQPNTGYNLVGVASPSAPTPQPFSQTLPA